MMRVQYVQSAKTFLEAAGTDLLTDEARHSLAFGIAERVALDTHAFGPDDPWFIILKSSGKICATAIRTPPHRTVLSHLCGDRGLVCSELVRSVHKIDPTIPGVVGEKGIADRFTQEWCAAYGSKIKDVMTQRIYRLTELAKVMLSEGGMRRAKLEDAELVIAWAAAFCRETTGDDPSPTHGHLYRQRIQQGSV